MNQKSLLITIASTAKQLSSLADLHLAPESWHGQELVPIVLTLDKLLIILRFTNTERSRFESSEVTVI